EFGNVKSEIERFNAENGLSSQMPTEKNLKATGWGSLANAIHQHGGFVKVAKDIGYQTKRKANGHYRLIGQLQRELLDWIETHGVTGQIPTAKQLRTTKPPRHDILQAIQKHGGFRRVADLAGLRMSHDTKPHGHYFCFDSVATE